eukprot:SAG31_NODE_2939_length_4883_cov_6.368102_3_plen_159_part_00
MISNSPGVPVLQFGTTQDATALSACLAAGTSDARTPEQCGCVDGNEGMRILIQEVKRLGFAWGSYSNEAGCMVEACAGPELEQSRREGFVSQDRSLYIDDFGSEYLMIDSVGITNPDCPGPACATERNRGNRTYGKVRGYFLVFVPTIREMRYFYREM